MKAFDRRDVYFIQRLRASLSTLSTHRVLVLLVSAKKYCECLGHNCIDWWRKTLLALLYSQCCKGRRTTRSRSLTRPWSITTIRCKKSVDPATRIQREQRLSRGKTATGRRFSRGHTVIDVVTRERQARQTAAAATATAAAAT